MENISLTEITISFSKIDIKELYSDWNWLLNENINPIMMSTFGDLFFQKNDDTIYFLDIMEGNIKIITNNIQNFKIFMSNVENQKNYLLSELVETLKENGFHLKKDQCYSFIKPHVLGGSNDLSNIEISDLSVWISIIGQIHNQVKDLPKGTKIQGVNFT